MQFRKNMEVFGTVYFKNVHILSKRPKLEVRGLF